MRGQLGWSVIACHVHGSGVSPVKTFANSHVFSGQLATPECLSQLETSGSRPAGALSVPSVVRISFV